MNRFKLNKKSRILNLNLFLILSLFLIAFIPLISAINNPSFETAINGTVDWNYSETDTEWVGIDLDTTYVDDGSYDYVLGVPAFNTVDQFTYCQIEQVVNLTGINNITFYHYSFFPYEVIYYFIINSTIKWSYTDAEGDDSNGTVNIDVSALNGMYNLIFKVSETSGVGLNSYNRYFYIDNIKLIDTIAPIYSDIGKNDTTIKVNDVVLFYANWSDTNGLSHYIFSWNHS
ncbi:MAG: hypothetical protein KKD44_29520, partial [Proteobacteria bacterium]|nr:hypothetical protein [Pseudomonadota bacterium]